MDDLRSRMQTSPISADIDPANLKRFVRHLCILSKRHYDREKARDSLEKQMDRLKRLSSEGIKPGTLENEMERLNKSLKSVLEKETLLLRYQKQDRGAIRELQERLNALGLRLLQTERAKTTDTLLTRQKLDYLNQAIFDLRSKLEYLIRVKTERQQRMEELERKIKQTFHEKSHPVSGLKERLKALEAQYRKLRKQHKSPASKLKVLKIRIQDLKNKLSYQK